MRTVIFTTLAGVMLTFGIACTSEPSGPFLDADTAIRLAETFEQREQTKIEDPVIASTAGCSTHINKYDHTTDTGWRYYTSADYLENGIWVVELKLVRGMLLTKKVCTYVVSDEDGTVTAS
jgi:hypothetical protein